MDVANVDDNNDNDAALTPVVGVPLPAATAVALTMPVALAPPGLPLPRPRFASGRTGWPSAPNTICKWFESRR